MTAVSQRLAVVGSGIAGLAAAWRLSNAPGPRRRVTLFEADSRFGGHAHTVDLSLDGVQYGVDTGFLVYNHATYPGLVQLFDALDVDTAPAEMSFSVNVPSSDGPGLEWSGSSLNSVFAQRRNLIQPKFWRMLLDLLRFNRLTAEIADRGADRGAEEGSAAPLDEPLSDFLARHRFSAAFSDHYLLPMLGCIWSCPTEQMLRFPVATVIRFCHNHGLNRLTDRPPWFTVRGGSREYVRKLIAAIPDARLSTPVRALHRTSIDNTGIWLATEQGSERFDAVVLACHSDQALALLGGHASADERRLLGAIRSQANRAVLHTDASLLPTRRQAWAAWNYERSTDAGRERSGVCLHYLINRLQPLPWQRPVLVSLNPLREPRAQDVHADIAYAHPVFDRAAIAAQGRLPSLQGQAGVWFAGAWTGYGFHEDGLRSGLAAAEAVLAAGANNAASASAWQVRAA